jgi:hypothetical protein
LPAAPGPGTLLARFGGPSEAVALIRRVTATVRFSPVLGLRGNARLIEATGPFACDPDEIWRVDVVISQGNAVADGHTQGFCSGDLGMWHVLAVARGRDSFAAGPAEGCGRISTRAGGEITDSLEWCGEFLLEPTE